MLFALLFLMALDPSKSANEYVRKTWDIDAGLPHNSVNAMAQSYDGYMWFGTENGLARFDGVRFTVFDKQHNSGLLSNQISSLAVDNDNNLWIGTRDGGLSRFQDGEFQSFLSQGIPGNSVRCLTIDAIGNLWIGTESSGLVRLSSGGVFQTFTVANGLLDNSINALASDSSGALWIATAAGLNLMQRGRLQTVSRSDFIRKLYLDRDHKLWFGTAGHGLLGADGGAYTRREGLADDTVTSIFQDSAGTFWVGTLGGLNRIAGGRVTVVESDASTRGDGVRSVLGDRQGGLWVGTESHGAICIRNGAVTTFARESGLPSETILPVFEDSKKSLWVGTNHGLAHMRGDRVDRFTLREGLPDELVSSIAEDGRGTIWIGTRHGLAFMHGKRFQAVPLQPGFEPGFIHCIFTDHSGGMWAGSRSGLTHFDGKRFVTYTSQDGLPDTNVLAIQQSRDGAIWIGTEGGLSVLREGRFLSYTADEGLPNTAIWAIAEDSEGNILLGTNGAGLVRFAGGKFAAFGSGQGLPGDTIYQIIDDHKGRLWLTSAQGIFSLRKSELSAALPGTRVNSRLYGTGDGMRTRQCSGGFQPAGTLAQDGRIWFPTAAGLSVLNPAELYEDSTPLRVSIEGLAINGKWFPPATGVRLEPEDRTLSFQFAAPSFSFSQRVQFRYWLTGFEDTWSTPSAETAARYTNIPAGEYEFRVAASRDGENWIEEAQPVKLIARARFYQTARFYFGCGSFVMALFCGFHSLRMWQLRKTLGPLMVKQASEIEAGAELLQLSAALSADRQEQPQPQARQAL